MSRCMQITFYLSNNIFDLIYLSVCSFVHVFVYLFKIFTYFSIHLFIRSFIYRLICVILFMYFIYLFVWNYTYVTGFVLLQSVRKWQAPSHAVEMPKKKFLDVTTLTPVFWHFQPLFLPKKKREEWTAMTAMRNPKEVMEMRDVGSSYRFPTNPIWSRRKRRCHGFVQTFQTLFQKVDPSYVPKELLHHQQW